MNKVEKVLKEVSSVAKDYRYIVVDGKVLYLQKPMLRSFSKIKRKENFSNNRCIVVVNDGDKIVHCLHMLTEKNQHVIGYYGEDDVMSESKLVCDGLRVEQAHELVKRTQKVMESSLCRR